jgi:hypothetical protein
MYRESEEKPAEALLTSAMSGKIALPGSRGALASLLTSLASEARQDLNLSDGASITLTFEHWSPLEVDPERLLLSSESSDMWWNWDAVYTFLRHRGFRIIESSVRVPVSNSGALFSVVVKATPRSAMDDDVYLRVPWGRKILLMKRSIYEQWLSWESFQKLDELEGLGWHLANEGKVEDGRRILRMAFALGRGRRTIERLFRVECKSLWNSLVRAR